MGRRLYETEPAFRATLDRCADAAAAVSGSTRCCRCCIPGDAGATIDRARDVHPARLFALEYALADLWRSWGIEPAAVLGHSLGEVRGRLRGRRVQPRRRPAPDRGARPADAGAADDGEMAAVFADESVVRAWSTRIADAVAVAAVNGPSNIVISGERACGARVPASRSKRPASGRSGFPRTRAFHSRLMDPILGELDRWRRRRRICGSAHYRDLEHHRQGRIARGDVQRPRIGRVTCANPCNSATAFARCGTRAAGISSKSDRADRCFRWAGASSKVPIQCGYSRSAGSATTGSRSCRASPAYTCTAAGSIGTRSIAAAEDPRSRFQPIPSSAIAIGSISGPIDGKPAASAERAVHRPHRSIGCRRCFRRRAPGRAARRAVGAIGGIPARRSS